MSENWIFFAFVMMSGVLVGMIYLVFYLISYKSMIDFENASGYECGFDFMTFTRVVFSYRFFLVGILFLIFDVEIVLMLPVPFLMEGNFFYLFIGVLVVGLLYEYSCGSLDWV